MLPTVARHDPPSDLNPNAGVQNSVVDPATITRVISPTLTYGIRSKPSSTAKITPMAHTSSGPGKNGTIDSSTPPPISTNATTIKTVSDTAPRSSDLNPATLIVIDCKPARPVTPIRRGGACSA